MAKKATRKTAKRSSAKRDLINTGTDARYVKRAADGSFRESDDVGRSQPVRCVSNILFDDAWDAPGGPDRSRQLWVNVVTSHRCSLSRHGAIDPRDGQGRRMRQGDS